MKNEEKNKIVISKFNDVLKYVDSDFAKILVLLNKHKIISDEKIARTFESKKNVESHLKELVVNYLNDKYTDLHGKLSKLRKKGIKLTELSLKLSTFKFKLRLFKANLDSHSFNKVVLILDEVKKETSNYEQNNIIK